jgi:hypothetical protein
MNLSPTLQNVPAHDVKVSEARKLTPLENGEDMIFGLKREENSNERAQ